MKLIKSLKMAVLRQIFLCCILFIVFYITTEILANDIYTNTWAVKVRGSVQEAKKLASKHDFSYVTHLFEDYHLYRRPELKERFIKTKTLDKFDRKLDLDSKLLVACLGFTFILLYTFYLPKTDFESFYNGSP